jgi:hypothetical protein
MIFEDRHKAVAFLREYYKTPTAAEKPHYCYILYDGDIPFYVGVSKSAKRLLEHERLNKKSDRDNFLKRQKIEKMHRTGKPITYQVVRFFTHVIELENAEKSLILCYGQIINKTGPLTNMASGGVGRAGLGTSDKQKIAASIANRGPKSAEVRRKLSDAMKAVVARQGAGFAGKTHTSETRAKMSTARRNPLHKQNNLRGENHFNHGKIHSEETRVKISEKLRSIDMSWTPEMKQRLRDYIEQQPVLTCPHCGKQMRNKAPFHRFHGDRCKHNQS